MRVVGLITEYNPFHNGHLHHLQESKCITGADAAVAVMSGHFLQRGEPALVDKWVRTEMALAAGVDVVLELPFPFACNSAPHFAMGAVRALNAFGVVDTLCFGSESGDLSLLDEVARTLVTHEDEIDAGSALKLREGINYPAARSQLLQQYLPRLDQAEISSPNNILGIEYLRALHKTASSIKACTIPRVGAGYHESEAVGDIASATGIRKMLAESQDVSPFLPEGCLDILSRALLAGNRLDPDRLFVALQSHLLQEPGSLQTYYHVADGLDRRLCDAALTAGSYQELSAAIKSRQWTLTRIQRILSYILLQAPADEMNRFVDSGPLYLRLLGCSEKGKAVLAKARKRKELPLFSDPARARNTLSRFYQGQPERFKLATQMLQIDLRATRLYGLLQSLPAEGAANRDYFQPLISVA